MNIHKNILATLTYFDLFDYPITQREIYLFLPSNYKYEALTETLRELKECSLIYQFEEFYSLQNDFHLVARRRVGNQKAKQLLKISGKVASFLSLFPFVRGIAISGSLSKYFADEKSDIDLFIITAKNRLWIARSLMHLFKKLTFLFNKQHLFCMNYYVDEEILQIREKNIYTAIEIATLIPLRGIAVFDKFYLQNQWVRRYLPNHSMKVSHMQDSHKFLYKNLIEKLLENKFGDYIDELLMNKTSSRWKKKTDKEIQNSRGIMMSMDASKHCAKPEPKNFQFKLILKYEHKLHAVLSQYENILNPTY